MATTERDVGGEPTVDRPSSRQGYIAWTTDASDRAQEPGTAQDDFPERVTDQEERLRAVVRETHKELRDVVAMYHVEIDQAIALRVVELNEAGNQRLDEFDRRFESHAASLEHRRPTTQDEIERTGAALDALTAFVEQTASEVRRHLDELTRTSRKAMRRAAVATFVAITAFVVAMGAGLAAVLLAS